MHSEFSSASGSRKTFWPGWSSPPTATTRGRRCLQSLQSVTYLPLSTLYNYPIRAKLSNPTVVLVWPGAQGLLQSRPGHGSDPSVERWWRQARFRCEYSHYGVPDLSGEYRRRTGDDHVPIRAGPRRRNPSARHQPHYRRRHRGFRQPDRRYSVLTECRQYSAQHSGLHELPSVRTKTWRRGLSPSLKCLGNTNFHRAALDHCQPSAVCNYEGLYGTSCSTARAIWSTSPTPATTGSKCSTPSIAFSSIPISPVGQMPHSDVRRFSSDMLQYDFMSATQVA